MPFDIALTPTSIAASAINDKHREVQRLGRTSKEIAAEIGELLLEQKKQLPHGEYEGWCEQHLIVKKTQRFEYVKLARLKSSERRTFDATTSINEALQTKKPKADPKPQPVERRLATLNDLRKVERLRALRDDPAATEGEKEAYLAEDLGILAYQAIASIREQLGLSIVLPPEPKEGTKEVEVGTEEPRPVDQQVEGKTEAQPELQTFDFNGMKMRAITVDGEPWFVAADAGRALGIKKVSSGFGILNGDEVFKVDRIYLEEKRGGRPMVCVSESGLYKLIMRCDKAEATPFQEWVTRDVLPALRKTGTYCVHDGVAPAGAKIFNRKNLRA